MKIIKYSLGQLQANCYFLIKNKHCLVIDPADEASFILEQIQRMKLKPIAFLATHGHFDHVMAFGEIEIHYKVSLHLYVHNNDVFLLKRLKETTKHFLGHDPRILEPQKIKFLKIGKMKIGNFAFEVIHTPGHTPGSCCFYFKNEKAVFAGDTLFKDGIGRYDFSYGNKIELFESLEKLFKLPAKTIVYSGHGEETTIGNEKDKHFNFL